MISRIARAAAVLCALLFAFAARDARGEDATLPVPVVVVYPFTVSGNTTDPQAGGNVAVLLSTRLQSLGGITVKPYTPGTQRAGFLTAAVAQNADYYVTGFLTPIGSDVSLVTQVVSTYGGTVIWSNTATIRTYEDALGQADGLRTAILNHADRGLASIAEAPAATPAPNSSDAAGVNLTRAFGRHRRTPATSASPAPATSAPAAAATSPAVVGAAPAATVVPPTAAPLPASPAPVAKAAPAAAVVAAAAVPKNSGAMVANVAGAADPALRVYAAGALASALRRAGLSGGTIAVTGAEAVENAAQLCRANPGNGALYVATLATNDVNAYAVMLDVTAYDCTGKAIGTEHDTEPIGKRISLQNAIDRAAAKIVQTFTKRPGG
jgi:hypothetical protein